MKRRLRLFVVIAVLAGVGTTGPSTALGTYGHVRGDRKRGVHRELRPPAHLTHSAQGTGDVFAAFDGFQ